MVEKVTPGGLLPQLFAPFQQFGAKLQEWLSPASEAASLEDAYEISMELPGVSEDDIDITMDGDLLTVRGEKKAEREERGEGWFFTERQYGAFTRSFRLPADADENAVQARLKDGVLTLRIGRIRADKGRARKIEIAQG